MTTTEMEERVARALDAVIDGWYDGKTQANLNTTDLARAAIRAMKSPTTEMLTCGYAAGYAADDGVDEVTEVLAEVVYTAMIRAASPGDAT